MQILFYIFLGLIAFLLQSAANSLIDIGGIRPDFLVIAVVWLAHREGALTGTLVGFGIGILQDSLEIDFFGLSVFTKSITGFVAGKLFQTEHKNKLSFTILILAISSLIHELLYFQIFYIGSGNEFFSVVFRYVIPGFLYTLIFGIVIYSVLPRRYWLM